MEENIAQDQLPEIQNQSAKLWLKIALFVVLGLVLASALVFVGYKLKQRWVQPTPVFSPTIIPTSTSQAETSRSLVPKTSQGLLKSRIVTVKSGAIWLMDIDGENAQKISDEGVFLNPKFSPDGKNIMFSSLDQSNEIKATFIYEIASRKLIQVSSPGIWSSGGGKIAYLNLKNKIMPERSGDRILLIYVLIVEDLYGNKKEFQLPNVPTFLPEDKNNYSPPLLSWSPDDKKIAYATTNKIGFVDRDSGSGKVLMEFKAIGGRCGEQCEDYWVPEIQWSKDSGSVLTAMVSDPGKDRAPWQVVKIGIDGVAKTLIINDVTGIYNQQEVWWDDTGEQIIYRKTSDLNKFNQKTQRFDLNNNVEIYIVNLDESVKKKVFEEKNRDVHPVNFYRTPLTPYKIFVHIVYQQSAEAAEGLVDQNSSSFVIDEQTLQRKILPVELNLFRKYQTVSPRGDAYIGVDYYHYDTHYYVYNNFNDKKLLPISITLPEFTSIYWAE